MTHHQKHVVILWAPAMTLFIFMITFTASAFTWRGNIETKVSENTNARKKGDRWTRGMEGERQNQENERYLHIMSTITEVKREQLGLIRSTSRILAILEGG